ncbi:MAG: LamG domain-containing protein [Sphingobacteriales bacterium]|nr:LamG domain-containing protein [Sphingobacteriales bacterium]
MGTTKQGRIAILDLRFRADVWSHIAVVITPTNATFYLNGVPSVRTATHIAVNFNSAFNIGNDRGNTSRTFNGLMDEVCIYNGSLSTNEVRGLMHLTSAYGRCQLVGLLPNERTKRNCFV